MQLPEYDQGDQGHKAHGVTEQERLSCLEKIQITGHTAGASEEQAVVKVSRTAREI